MPLLGTPQFSLGASGGDPSMGKSLDDMIHDRRKTQQKELKRGAKKATGVDRSIGTSRAKREAAAKNRRGLTQTKKPSKMEIDNQIKQQSQKTQTQKKKREQKQTKGRIAPDTTGRRKTRSDTKNQKADPPAAVSFGGRAPPKKAIEAAIKGMTDAGFQVPQGHQLVMTFVPMVGMPAPGITTPKGKPDFKGNKNKNNGSKKGNANAGGGGGSGNRKKK